MQSIIWNSVYVAFVVLPPILSWSGLVLKSSKLMYIAASLSIPISLYMFGSSQTVLLAITMLLILPLLFSLSGYFMHRRYYLALVLALLPSAAFVFMWYLRVDEMIHYLEYQ